MVLHKMICFTQCAPVEADVVSTLKKTLNPDFPAGRQGGVPAGRDSGKDRGGGQGSCGSVACFFFLSVASLIAQARLYFVILHSVVCTVFLTPAFLIARYGVMGPGR